MATTHPSYTLDGSTPTGASPVYPSGGFVISPKTIKTVQAIGTKSGMNDSAVASANYTILVGMQFDRQYFVADVDQPVREFLFLPRNEPPDEKEISHGRVSWQTRANLSRNGAVGFIDWLDARVA
jgi:hypothetical protein